MLRERTEDPVWGGIVEFGGSEHADVKATLLLSTCS